MTDRYWTDPEIDLLRWAYPDAPAILIADVLQRTPYSVRNKVRELGLKKSPDFARSLLSGAYRTNSNRRSSTAFLPGNRPWNKGRRFEAGGRSNATRYQPGNRPASWLPIGSERTRHDGYRERKISDTGHAKIDWRTIHTLIWEQHHGSVPPGHCVLFLNLDKSDLRPDNLALVTRAELAWINKHDYCRLDPSLRPAGIAVAKLEVRKNAVLKRRAAT